MTRWNLINHFFFAFTQQKKVFFLLFALLSLSLLLLFFVVFLPIVAHNIFLLLSFSLRNNSSAVPSKPQNVRVLDVTSTTVRISWTEPERPNGVIHAYRVYYMFLNQTLLHLPMLKNDASVSSPFQYVLINLSEFFILHNIHCWLQDTTVSPVHNTPTSWTGLTCDMFENSSYSSFLWWDRSQCPIYRPFYALYLPSSFSSRFFLLFSMISQNHSPSIASS